MNNCWANGNLKIQSPSRLMELCIVWWDRVILLSVAKPDVLHADAYYIQAFITILIKSQTSAERLPAVLLVSVGLDSKPHFCAGVSHEEQYASFYREETAGFFHPHTKTHTCCFIITSEGSFTGALLLLWGFPSVQSAGFNMQAAQLHKPP